MRKGAKKSSTPRKSGPHRPIGPARAIALALVKLIEDVSNDPDFPSAVQETIAEGRQALKDHGFEGLQSITSRVDSIQEQIHAAVLAGNGKEVSRLGLELDRARQGKPPVTNKAQKQPDATPPPKDDALAAGQ